jgi:hypothetical protein
MLKLSHIRHGAVPREGRQKSAPPATRDAGQMGRRPDDPRDALPLNTLGRFLIAHWTPDVCQLSSGRRVLIWRELWDRLMYPAEYYGLKNKTSHV